MIRTMRRKSRSERMKNELGQGVDHFKRAAALAAQETSATVGPTLTAAVDRVQPAAVKAKDAASSGWGSAKDAANTGWGSAVSTITPLVTAAADNVRQTGKTTPKVSRKSMRKAVKENQKAVKQNEKSAKKLQKRADKAVGKKRSGSKLLGFALLGTAFGIAAAYAAKRRQAAQWDEYEPATPLVTPPAGPEDAAAETAVFEPAVEPTVEPTPYSSPNGTLPSSTPNTPR